MRSASLLALALVPLAVAGPAGAVSFGRADKDRDGAVTYAEARRTMPRLREIHFSKCDGDRDGVLSQGEFPCLDALYSIVNLPGD